MMDRSQQLIQQYRQKQPPKAPRDLRKRNAFFSALMTLVTAGIVLVIMLDRQWFIDQYTVLTFKPSNEITSIANQASLSDKGKFYLYASRAEIDDRTAFNSACSKLLNEKTVVLGCYTGVQRRIYVFQVTDDRLKGVEEVTAAHEMLHAAYDRLGQGEKDRVDALLLAQEKSITDSRLLALIEEYKTSEPTEVVNELHSIFGTEVRTLSPELESYYAQYFTDRSAVVGLKEAYEKVFTDLAGQQKQLVNELNTLANDVNTRQAQYQTTLAALNADIASFNTWAQSGVATRSEYNTRRAALENRVTALDTERNAINAEIDQYNTKKSQLDSLNVQAEGLNQSIDSKQLPTTPTL